MVYRFSNNATTVCSASIATGDTVISVASGTGSFFPVAAVGAGVTYPLTISDALGNKEIVLATSRSGDLLTVVRAQEGTTARTFPAGSRVDLRLTAAVLTKIVDDIDKRVAFDSATALTDPQKLQARSNIGAQASLGFTPVKQGTTDTITQQWNAANGSISLTVNTTYVGEFATQSFVNANYIPRTGGTILGNFGVQGAGVQISFHYPSVRIWYLDVESTGSFRLVDSTAGQYAWSVNTAGQMAVRGYGWLHEYFATSASLAATNATLNDRVSRTAIGDYAEHALPNNNAMTLVPSGKVQVGMRRLTDGQIPAIASGRLYQWYAGAWQFINVI